MHVLDAAATAFVSICDKQARPIVSYYLIHISTLRVSLRDILHV